LSEKKSFKWDSFKKTDGPKASTNKWGNKSWKTNKEKHPGKVPGLSDEWEAEAKKRTKDAGF